MPNYLGHADNYIAANPLLTPAHIVPEWYFLPFYAILRADPCTSSAACSRCSRRSLMLAFLPWLDTSQVRSAAYRPLYRHVLLALRRRARSCSAICGSQPPEGGYVIAVADR